MAFTRREVFGAIGVAAGSCVLSSCAREELSPQRDGPTFGRLPWPYTELDPQAVAERAYGYYSEGHCMYAVFKGILAPLAERHGEPYRSFPCEMMAYGAGGVAGWGSLCGALNGAAAAIALFAADKEQRASLTGRVFLWYEQTELPVWAPAAPRLEMQGFPSVAHSVLCHASVARWSKAAGHPVGGREQVERCARLAAETARQTANALNEGLAAPRAQIPGADPQVIRCNSCHGPGGERKNAMGRMTCGSCHDPLAETHPKIDKL